MRNLLALIALLSFLALGTAAGAGAEPAPAFTFHLQVPAVAEFFGSSCAHGEYPPLADRLCDDIAVLYFRESEPSTLRDAHWGLEVHHFVGVQHPDQTDTVLVDTFGFLDNAQGSFDEKTFASAAVSGSVPMSDGSTAVVDLTWDMAAAPLNHGGNDSAFNLFNGIDRHFADPCLTVNSFAHQQWRAGAPGLITGSIIGRNVDDWDRSETEPFIAGRSIFTFIYVEHGGC